MKLSTAQQNVIDALKNSKRLTCVDHTSTGVFAGKLYNATLSSSVGSVHTTTLKALIAKGLLKERHRATWHKAPGQWVMYKVEYELAQKEV